MNGWEVATQQALDVLAGEEQTKYPNRIVAVVFGVLSHEKVEFEWPSGQIYITGGGRGNLDRIGRLALAEMVRGASSLRRIGNPMKVRAGKLPFEIGLKPRGTSRCYFDQNFCL